MFMIPIVNVWQNKKRKHCCLRLKIILTQIKMMFTEAKLHFCQLRDNQ